MTLGLALDRASAAETSVSEQGRLRFRHTRQPSGVTSSQRVLEVTHESQARYLVRFVGRGLWSFYRERGSRNDSVEHLPCWYIRWGR